MRSIAQMCPDGELAFNTVQTLLRIMEDKGLVRHRAEGRTFVYEPIYSRDRVTSRLLHRVFDGALDQVVLSLLAGEGRQRGRTAGAGADDRRGPKAEGIAGRREMRRAIEMDWQVLAWRRLADAAVGGLIVLAVGSLAARLCRQPVRRARLVVLTLLGGLAVPCLGALPVAPHWSAGFLPAPAAPRSRPTTRPPAMRSHLRRARAAGSRVVLEPHRAPGDVPRRARPHRTAPSLIGAGEPSAGGVALSSARTVLLVVLFRRGGRVGGLVARRAVLALAGDPGGAPGPASGPRRLRRPQRARRASGSSSSRATGSPCRSPTPGLRPVIVLPSALCDGGDPEPSGTSWRTSGRMSSARDAWAWNLACLAGLVLFYQPLFWWLRRQLRLCQDYLADARAAAVGSAEDYAAFLVRLARAAQSGLGVPALGIGDRRLNLYRRIVMLVQDHEPLERRCRAAWSLRRRGRGRRDRRRLGLRLTPPRRPRPSPPRRRSRP